MRRDFRISDVLGLVFFGSFCYDYISTGQAKANGKARGPVRDTLTSRQYTRTDQRASEATTEVKNTGLKMR